MKTFILAAVLLAVALVLASGGWSPDAWYRTLQTWPSSVLGAIAAIFVLIIPLSGFPVRLTGCFATTATLLWLVAIAVVIAYLLAGLNLIRLPWA